MNDSLATPLRLVDGGKVWVWAEGLLCSRNTRSRKGGSGTARPSFLLAETARSECAPSMRAVKDSLTAPLRATWEKRKALARVHGTSREIDCEAFGG